MAACVYEYSEFYNKKTYKYYFLRPVL